MPTVKQVRTKVANELLAWMVEHDMKKGVYTYDVVQPFSAETGYDMPDVWKSWEILQDNLRVTKHKGPGWEILDTKPIE